MLSPDERLIVALDTPDLGRAEDLVVRLRSIVHWFKVGSELFTSHGPRAVTMVQGYGGRVFLDVKLHDIPHTAAGAVAAAVRLGVDFLTVHVAGGEAMLHAAAQAAAPPLRLLGVTVLTSEGGGEDLTGRVVEAARLAQRCGLHGVVASPLEARAVKDACGSEFLVVTPGVRTHPVSDDDQRRTLGPGEALSLGADYLVVGRPITRAPDPLEAARALLAAMEPTPQIVR